VFREAWCQPQEGQQDGAEQQHHLHDIGYDNGAHATEDVVGDGDHHEQQHRLQVAEARDQGQHRCHAVDRDAGRDTAKEQKAGAGGEPYASAQAILEETVDGNRVSIENRHKQQRQAEHREGYRELVLQPTQAAAGDESDKGRGAQQTVGRALRGDDGYGQGPAGQGAAAEIIVAPRPLRAAQPPRERQHRGEIDGDDDPVEACHAGLPASQRCHCSILCSPGTGAALTVEQRRGELV
jgi:hypothetical protein